MRICFVLMLALAGLLLAAMPAGAAGSLVVPVAAAAPFALLLAAIAILPLALGHWWHANTNKAIITALIATPIALYLLSTPGGTPALVHAMQEYVEFIILLGALYTIAGGVAVTGDLPGHPSTNITFLGMGAVLANLIGTTGASMLLIRPLLKTNRERKQTRHLPIFFIFIVSNCGGLLTPLGDPPLFLGFLQGVDFFWTLRLWPQWLFVNGTLLLIFAIIEYRAYARETPGDIKKDETNVHPLRIAGWKLNGPLMLGIVAAVIAKKYVTIFPLCEIAMVLLTLVSIRFTPRSIRDANGFAWGPILEVAVLFAGIFVTMVPALALLNQHGKQFGVTEPWHFFWVTGFLSSGLDNAPTYLTMGELGVIVTGAANLPELSLQHATLLAAVSCGAVFMGANSYIGNGPNFMVKAIAEEQNYKMPSFFGYMMIAGTVLLPIFVLTTLLFFRG